MSKIVIALGGNALQPKGSDASAEAQLKAVRQTCQNLVSLTMAGYEIAIVHGNGPQVGRILLASETAGSVVPAMPFDVCGAMSQGYIGYHLQQAMKYALNRNNVNLPVVTLATQVVVEENDSAFHHPTKPIGQFYSETEAKRLMNDKGYTMAEDAGRGWRRVVASPIPRKIIEIDAIRQLWDSTIVITCGGGGIPVIERSNGMLEGVPAVIDKDYAAELLAEQVGADILLILTEVEKAAIHFNTPQQQNLSHLTLDMAAQYVEEGQFAAGSMLPKIQAAMKFVRNGPDKKAIITSINKALDALNGQSGTLVTFN